MSFLETNIVTKFDVPEFLFFNNVSYFSFVDVTQIALEKGIQIKYSSNYYPKGDDLVESTNNNLIKILKRTVAGNHKNYHTKFINTL